MITEEKIISLFEKTFEGSELDYYVDDILFTHRGIFTIKFWIENLGTVIESFDYNSLSETLIELKFNILKNALKCPICESKNIKNDICECGAKFTRASIQTVSNNKTISSFNHFNNFVENIHKHTLIPVKAISLYIEIGGDLSDIITGSNYVYEGLNEYPIFVTSNNISLKDNIDPLIEKVLFYCLMANDEQYLSNKFYDFQYKEINFYLEKNDSSGIIIKAPEKHCYGNNQLYILFPYNREELCEVYKKQYNLSCDDDEAFDLVTAFDEWFIDKYYEGYVEQFNYDRYFVYEFNIPKNINSFADYKDSINNFIIQCNEEIELNKKLALLNFEEFNIYKMQY